MPVVALDDLNATLPHLCENCRVLVEDLPVKRQTETSSPLDTRVAQINELLRQTCNEFGVAVADVQAKNNVPQVVKVRARFCSRAHDRGYSYPEIGRAICKHHTAAVYLAGALKNRKPKNV